RPVSLRFAFSDFQKLPPEEIRQVAPLVNKRIREARALEERRDCPIDEARGMGAMALFGEKYGDKVRVVKFGDSIELCGGTHVRNTGNIGMVRIINESSIAAGIRRIEAVTGEGVEKVLDTFQDDIKDLHAILGNNSDLKQAVAKAIKENADLQAQVEEFMAERIKNLTKTLMENAEVVDGVNVIVLEGTRLPDVVKTIAFNVRKDAKSPTAFIAATQSDGKPLLTVSLTDDLVKDGGLNASQIVRNAAKNIKGGGGGQPFFAQAGGKDINGIAAALQSMRDAISNK
ncbi:MAG: alanine--tRNA ligase, partial [Muribaculaceae bacterium]|nr:alanine--tRNA ligase [Muribaculaceae bacterium]